MVAGICGFSKILDKLKALAMLHHELSRTYGTKLAAAMKAII
jgi:hypothetical protein